MAVTKRIPRVTFTRSSMQPSDTSTCFQSSAPLPTSIQAFTLAALSLPGLILSPLCVAAADDEASFHYGYYQEGERNLFGQTSHLNPIHVDTLNSTGTLKLTDRINFGFNYTQDTWSGATPITTAPVGFMIDGLSGASSHINTGTNALIDKNFNPLKEVYLNGSTLSYQSTPQSRQLVHMLTSASPETRKQVDVKLGYEWDEVALNLVGGVSSERDYESHFISSNSRWDLNQKLTALNFGMSYADNSINAERMPSASGYIDYSAHINPGNGTSPNIKGNKQDWMGSLGLTQVLSKSSLLASSLGFSRSTGYLSNPYKASTFVFKDPNQTHNVYPSDVYVAEIIDALEKRPDARNQFTWDMRFVQHIAPLDAALHFNYRFFQDDWDISAHTFDASWDQPITGGWTITPKIRYYSQNAADFYQPIYYFNQLKPKNNTGGIDYSKLPISNFSSDHRLSGYGALSGGITLSKTFTKGISFDAGVEYYSHAGGLKLGGGGENAYADFDYYLVNAGLKVNLSALSIPGGDHDYHAHHHHGSFAPAGMMFDHIMENPGDVMVGYRYMYGRQADNMLQGTNVATDQMISNQACGNENCLLAPGYMNMHMHMLDLMYAPTSWLNLMLMPQFVDMNMSLKTLENVSPSELHKHATGGVGDTGIYALIKLFDIGGHHFHTALGLSAPTGDSKIKLNPGGHHGGKGGYIHYGMQLGSGTWDFKPSITYSGQLAQWSWGGQINGTVRMENQNPSGYALGDLLQSTAWGGYQLFNWLSASVRGVYTVQGAVKNEFNGLHPTDSSVDYPGNYGGRYWDVGFGLSAIVPSGDLAGNRIAFEWLQPVADDVNGYQLEREGALSANWSFAF